MLQGKISFCKWFTLDKDCRFLIWRINAGGDKYGFGPSFRGSCNSQRSNNNPACYQEDFLKRKGNCEGPSGEDLIISITSDLAIANGEVPFNSAHVIFRNSGDDTVIIFSSIR